MLTSHRYIAKAKASFKTKLNLFLFDFAIRKTSFEQVSLKQFTDFRITEELEYNYFRKYWQYDYNKELKEELTVGVISNTITKLKCRLPGIRTA